MDTENAPDNVRSVWEFIEVRVGRSQTWKWSVGAISRASASFSGYGEAVTDAIENGFSPTEHDWVVVGASGSVHLYKGRTAGATGEASQIRRPR